MDSTRRKPVVFVSSTCYDLKQIREDLKAFFEDNYGFQTMLSEFDSFPVDPCIGTFENCLNNIDKHADIFVLIIGTRYGYVTDLGKSITNLEYLHAKAKGIPVFVFVDKYLHNNLRVWKKNPSGDFSSIVDNPKIFEFVSEIADEAQWIYTYESVRDITMSLRQQLCLIFSDGLAFKKITSSTQHRLLLGNLPANAARLIVEKPFAWEYKFFAHVLKHEFNELQNRRWDFKYGIVTDPIINKSPQSLLDCISEKLAELLNLTNLMSTLLNTTFQDALGEPGSPSDLDMLVYVSKQFASLYERMVSWALSFKTLHADDVFSKLLHLLYELPRSTLDQVDDFVIRVYNEMTSIPDIEDNVERSINVSIVLDAANLAEINSEIQRLSMLLT